MNHMQRSIVKVRKRFDFQPGYIAIKEKIPKIGQQQQQILNLHRLKYEMRLETKKVCRIKRNIEIVTSMTPFLTTPNFLLI